MWAGAALGVAGVVLGTVYNLFVPDMEASDRWLWLLAGIFFAALLGVTVAAALGLSARDRWGPSAGWTSVALLGVSIIGAPIAAAVGWGLSQAKGQLVADYPRAGGGTRLAGGGAACLLALIVISGTAAWGASHPYSTTGPTATTPTPCTILQPDTAITPDAVGTECTFKFKSSLSQIECRTVGTSLPAGFSQYSYDFNKKAAGGGAAVTVDSSGCHLTAPANLIEEQLRTGDLASGDVLAVADFVAPNAKFDLGVASGCDPTGCLSGDLFTVDNTVGAFDDDTKFPAQKGSPLSGTNRLVLVIQGKQIRVWFNGDLMATQTAGRIHESGFSAVYLENFATSGAVSVDVLRFAVYRLQS